MIDLGSIIGGVTSIASGGILGLVGAVGSGVIDLLKGKSKDENNVKELAIKSDIIKNSGDKASDILKALNSSYNNDKATYQNAGFVDTIRGLVRPITMGVLLTCSVGITFWAFKKVGLEIETQKDIAKYGFYMCLHLTSICTTWYFGGRELQKIRRLK